MKPFALTARVRRTSSTLAVILSIMGMGLFAGSSSAQDSNNAAGWYAQAMQDIARVSHDDWVVVERYANSPAMLVDASVATSFQRLQGAFTRVLRGSERSGVDFRFGQPAEFRPGVPREFEFQLMARLAALLHAGAKYHGELGDMKQAGESLAAGYRMIHHLSQDHSDLARAVAGTLLLRTDRAVDQSFRSGIIGRDQAVQLLDALEKMDGSDPAGATGAFLAGMAQRAAWYERLFDEEGSLASAHPYLPDEAPPGVSPENLTRWQFDETLARLPQLMDRARAILATTDATIAKERAEALTADLDGTIAGYLFFQLADVMSHHQYRHQRGANIISARRNMLERVRDGELVPEVNAAWLYLRSANRWRQTHPDTKAAIRLVLMNAGWDGDVPDPMLLEPLRACVKVLDHAAAMTLCDFSAIFLVDEIVRSNDRGPRSEDVAALHEIMSLHLRLIEQDLRRSARGGGDRFDTSGLHRIITNIAHVSLEPTLHGSLILAAFFESKVAPLLVRAANGMDEESRRRLRAHLEQRFPLHDPFRMEQSARHEQLALADDLDVLIARNAPAEPGEESWRPSGEARNRAIAASIARVRAFRAALQPWPPLDIHVLRLAAGRLKSPERQWNYEPNDLPGEPTPSPIDLDRAMDLLRTWIAASEIAAFEEAVFSSDEMMTFVRSREVMAELLHSLGPQFEREDEL